MSETIAESRISTKGIREDFWLGAKLEEVEGRFESVEEKTDVGHQYSMSYERYKILVCRGMKKPLPEVWASLKHWN